MDVRTTVGLHVIRWADGYPPSGVAKWLSCMTCLDGTHLPTFHATAPDGRHPWQVRQPTHDDYAAYRDVPSTATMLGLLLVHVLDGATGDPAAAEVAAFHLALTDDVHAAFLMYLDAAEG